jgi:hypothetical protein
MAWFFARLGLFAAEGLGQVARPIRYPPVQFLVDDA